MQYRFNYPKIRQLNNGRLYSEIKSSLSIINYVKITEKCNIIITIYKKFNKTNNKPFSRNYYDYENLKKIIIRLFNFNVINWEFKECATTYKPEILIDVVTINDLRCQYRMLKNQLKNIKLQMTSLNNKMGDLK